MQTKRKLLVAGVALAVNTQLVGAATHTVTIGADAGVGSLRAAIEAASSGDIIKIDSGLDIVLDSPLTNGGKSLIIHADGAAGAGASISPSGTGYRLLEFGNPIESDDDASELSQIILAGLTLTGADSQAPGGAMYGENIDLTLFQSSITGNSGVLAGGGALLRRSAVCLDSATISDNELQTHALSAFTADGMFGLGGGMAIEGTLGNTKYGVASCARRVAEGEVFGLSEAEAEALFPKYDDERDGSLVSGNSIVMPEGAEGATIVAAAGGGLAVMTLNADQYLAGATTLSNVDVLNNSIQVSNVTSDAESRYTFVAGGGVFLGSTGDASSVIFGSSISGNQLISDVTSSDDDKYDPSLSTAFGGGVAVLSDSNPTDGSDDSIVGLSWLAEIKYAVTDPGFGLPELGPIGSFDSEGSISAGVKYSLVDDNHIGVSVQGVEGSTSGGSQTQAFGGGIAVVQNDAGSFGDDKYDGPSVIGVLAGVSGNTVDVSLTDVADYASQIGGGGVAAGRLAVGPGASGIRLDEGKYFSILTSLVDNSVIVSGVGESAVIDGLVGGGGVLATNSSQLGDKFYMAEESVSDLRSDNSATGLSDEQLISLFTRDGGVTGNSVQVQDLVLAESSVGGGGGMHVDQSLVSQALEAGGQGSFSIVKYGSVTGNAVTVSGSALYNSSITGGGLSVGMVPREGTGFQGGNAFRRYSVLSVANTKVSGNSITVSGDATAFDEGSGGTVLITGAGAHVGGASYFYTGDTTDLPDVNSFTQLKYSSLSNNVLSVSGVMIEDEDPASPPWEDVLVTGGSALSAMGSEIGGDETTIEMGLINLTVYGNDHSLTLGDSSGFVLGGAIASVSPDLYMPHATISDNTSSLDGEPYGGQLGSLLGSGEVDIINSLVSGSAAQGPSGDFVFIDADAAQLERVSIVNTASSFPYSGLDGFLSSDLADPSVFDELSSAYPGTLTLEDGKYLTPQRVEYLPLVQGSAPIDPQAEGGACATSSVLNDDTLHGPRDNCPDLGAYEYGGDADSDGVSSVEESNGPAGLGPLDPGFDGSGQTPYVLNTGDGNSDGVPDSGQSDVTTLLSDKGWFTLHMTDPPDVSGQSQLTNVALATDLGTVATNLGVFDTSLGGLSFTASFVGTEPVAFDLIAPLRGSIGDMSLIKHQCDAGSASDDWVVLDGEAEAFGADRVRFSFEIEPNGALDCDDDSTTLTDPSYVVSKVQKTVVPVPGLSGWMLGVLAGLAAVLGANLARRDRRDRRAR